MLNFRKMSRRRHDDGFYLNTANFELRWSARGPYNYYFPLDVKQFIMGDEVLREIIATAAFSRLRSISFLGGIDYVLVRHPNQSQRRYTRYEHSLGVAKLSSLYSKEIELSYDERRLVCVSALLHDIGHAPLSHSLESVFLKYFDIEHHRATEDIITGRVEIGKDVLDILKWHKIDVDRVISIINGKEKSFDGFFHGPINFDTIEGILRTYSYAAKSKATVNPVMVTKSAISRATNQDRQNVDEFWMYKDLVYNTIITSDYGILADKICQKHMMDNLENFSKNDYFTDEPKLFTKLHALKKILTSRNFPALAEAELSYPLRINRRRFIIDDSIEFSTDTDMLRYKQFKERVYVHKTWAGNDNPPALRDFFDDDTI